MKSIIKFLFLGLILIFIIIGGIFIGYKSLISPVSNDTSLIEVDISDGSSLKSAARLLEEKNLIKNETAFLIYAKINSLENIKSGTQFALRFFSVCFFIMLATLTYSGRNNHCLQRIFGCPHRKRRIKNTQRRQL